MLFRSGIEENDVITICMPNVFEVVYAFYAGIKLGAVCHMVHPLTPVNQLKTQMKQTKSKLLFIVDTFYDNYHNMTKELNVPLILVTPVDSFGFVKKIGYQLINKKRLSNIEYSNLVRPFSSLLKYQEKVNSAQVEASKTARSEEHTSELQS